MKLTVKQRSCGECTLCCTAIAVNDLKKPPGRTCQFVCSHGCSIYEHRPSSCAQFRCWWLNQAALDDPQDDILDRPDKMGIVLFPQKTSVGPALVAFPGQCGAFDNPVVREYLNGLSKQYVVFVMSNPRVILCPENMRTKVRYMAEEIKRQYGTKK